MSTAAIQKLTVKEAAEQLRISAALVYALCAAGKISHERHGLGRGTIRITLEALEEYRKAAEFKPAAPVLVHIKPR
jgi:excisionase family DNA binding protein